MAFKAQVATIIGKTIKHVVVKEGDDSPRSQVFLVFTDDTYYEFYSAHGSIAGAGAQDIGGIEATQRILAADPAFYTAATPLSGPPGAPTTQQEVWRDSPHHPPRDPPPPETPSSTRCSATSTRRAPGPACRRTP